MTFPRLAFKRRGKEPDEWFLKVRIMKHGFLRRLLDRVEKIDKEQIVDYMREIAQERDLLALIFESMIEGMMVIDSEETVLYINQSARDILNLDAGATTPDRPLERVLVNPHLLAVCRECIQSPTPILSREYHLDLPEGERFLYVNMIPLKNKTQRVSSLFLFMDVTEQKAQEKKLREAEKLAALTTLSAGMSHEIRNPLNSLSIHLQLLERQLKKKGVDDKETSENLAVITNEIKRLNNVIETFLSAVRPTQPQLRLVNLYTLITDTLTLMEPEFRQHGIRVALHEEGEWPYIKADDVLMKQAVINILRNAIEAIIQQQDETRAARPGEVVISMVRDGDTVNLIFSDNGRGIDREDLKHIFEPYFTTKPNGTGLGLMIVDRIIREHQGALSAHSEPGQGTQLAITLPVAAESPRLLEHGSSHPDGTAPGVSRMV